MAARYLAVRVSELARSLLALGEAADMDLAFVTGYGPTSLVDLAGERPIVEPGDVVVMGHRADLNDTRHEVALVDERIQLVEAKAIRRGDPERLGRYVAQRLEAQAGRFWLRLHEKCAT